MTDELQIAGEPRRPPGAVPDIPKPVTGIKLRLRDQLGVAVGAERSGGGVCAAAQPVVPPTALVRTDRRLGAVANAEVEAFCAHVLHPLERELMEAHPTSREGIAALLDLALDEYPSNAGTPRAATKRLG